MESVKPDRMGHRANLLHKQYELQCDVLNVAPVQNLIINWYKGQTLVDQTIFTDTIKTPVSKTSKLLIRPDRADDGAQYWCEAKLELGEEGPQPPPEVTSDPFSISVPSEPIINETKLPSIVPVFRGYPVEIVCEAEGNPTPLIRWNISTTDIVYSETLTITESTPEDLHCIANNSAGTTIRSVKVSIQETPDSVSISTVNHTGPMMEGNQYELQCDVLNVAPVQNLIINWYKGQTLVDQTIFTDTIKTPVSKTSKLLIRPDGADDGDQYWCEAKLELGEEGPQPPPEVTSDPLNIIVYYGPIINENKLPSIVPVFRGYPVEIVCEAEGNPTPIISWNLSTTDIVYSETLTITESTPEDLHCIASNSAGTTIRRVKVSIQGSYADECPVQLNPQRVIVEFGGFVSVNCSTSVPHTGMGWEAIEGAVPMSGDSLITWRVSNLTEWDIEAFCYINYNKVQCTVSLPMTIYKTPDSVSISTVNHTGPMMEGNQYELQCDVLNVAPVQNLIINWYKGQTLVDQTIFTDTIKTPVSKTSKLLIRADRADDGAQYWCEAKLELGEEGPQPPPTAPSKTLNVEVFYKPKHSSSTETISINDELNCTVKANPAPTYSWQSDHLKETITSSVLQSSTLRSGNYKCIASNSLGSDSKVFILKSTVGVQSSTGWQELPLAGHVTCQWLTGSCQWLSVSLPLASFRNH
ncbi:EGF-like domain-containing protein [Pimephales promelas]|nr:EGF-like domain-containing protein [Pimephales promelas]